MEGRGLSLLWALPFCGLLLSIALLPLLAPRLWHRHDRLVTLGWTLAMLLPFAGLAGWHQAWHGFTEVLLLDYLPFILLLLALYTTGGGVLLRGTLVGTPTTNTALLALGTALASLMGTTGASMLLIRPLLRANAFRQRRVHTVVFFIFLVANIGGSLTPLGDPPLYLGFLAGVPFFWPGRTLWPVFLLCAGLLLAFYWVLDSLLWARERHVIPEPGPREGIRVSGWSNLWLLGLVVAGVLVQGVWRPGEVEVLGHPLGLERLAVMALCLSVTFASLRLTPAALRRENGFNWHAMREVAELFAAIFITMAPLLAILRAGEGGAAAGLLRLVSDGAGQPVPWVYFWVTGLLSSFLDNAPTYLVFFNLAGGDAAWLTGEGARVLAAISCGAVFMGANSYIGNAPNFMVRSVAEAQGVLMPSFFGYCAWAFAILVPLFVLVTLIFF